jgi:hypothetical protein
MRPSTPTGQPTSNPTHPTPIPTRRPTRHPTAQPTSLPTSQPTSAPSNPTSFPSFAPTADSALLPVIGDHYGTRNFTYTCRPIHLHSTPNVYERIFGGLSIETTAPIVKMIISVEPFNAAVDQLALAAIGELLPINVQLVSNGKTMIVSSATTTLLTLDQWTTLMTYPAFRLNTDKFLPHSCPKFTDGHYHRMFSMYLIDRYGRHSNSIKKKLLVETAVIVYSNAQPVVISNLGAFWKTDLHQNIYDPVRSNPALTNFTEGMPWFDLTATSVSLGK